MGLKLCTRVLQAGESLEIVASMNCMQVTYQMSTGSSDAGSVTGDFTAVDKNGDLLPSQTQTIPPGGGQTIPASADRPIDGVTLACGTGTMNVTLGF